MKAAGHVISIDVKTQRLQLHQHQQLLFAASIATARNGTGEQHGSECTPRGWHIVRARIGAGAAVNTVFKGRRPTGEIYSAELQQQFPQRDWILTRILWLSGLEPGFNRLHEVDTMRRYIYIHGCPDTDAMGEASSHGCIKMHNDDIITLFDLTPAGTRVLITE